MRTIGPGDAGVAGGTRRGQREALRPASRELASLADIGEGWQAAARCRSEDATLFFGPNRFEPKQERMEREARAKAVCASCPVMPTCREQAIATGELYGVWGGLGEADRRSLMTQRDRVARAV